MSNRLELMGITCRFLRAWLADVDELFDAKALCGLEDLGRVICKQGPLPVKIEHFFEPLPEPGSLFCGTDVLCTDNPVKQWSDAGFICLYLQRFCGGLRLPE